jgi:hypothetical protein
MNQETYKIKQAEQADLNKRNKAYREELLSDAKRNGVGIVHIFCTENNKGGLTVAFRKVKPRQQSTNMVDVAVATCSIEDTFSRKIGTELALAKWFDGDTIQLPLSSGWPDEDLNGRVKLAFAAMWKSLQVY